MRDLDHWYIATGGGGEYAILWANPDGRRRRIEVYDLSDGRRRTFDAPPDAVILENPLYVTSQEMLVYGVMGDDSTLFRVQLASLSYDGWPPRRRAVRPRRRRARIAAAGGAGAARSRRVMG